MMVDLHFLGVAVSQYRMDRGVDCPREQGLSGGCDVVILIDAEAEQEIDSSGETLHVRVSEGAICGCHVVIESDVGGAGSEI